MLDRIPAFKFVSTLSFREVVVYICFHLDVLDVKCLPDSIEVHVPASFFLDQNIPLRDLHLLDYNCIGAVHPNSSDTWVFIIPTFSSCSTELIVRYMLLSNTVFCTYP